MKGVEHIITNMTHFSLSTSILHYSGASVFRRNPKGHLLFGHILPPGALALKGVYEKNY